jgi:hypothetical protein
MRIIRMVGKVGIPLNPHAAAPNIRYIAKTTTRFAVLILIYNTWRVGLMHDVDIDE